MGNKNSKNDFNDGKITALSRSHAVARKRKLSHTAGIPGQAFVPALSSLKA